MFPRPAIRILHRTVRQAADRRRVLLHCTIMGMRRGEHKRHDARRARQSDQKLALEAEAGPCSPSLNVAEVARHRQQGATTIFGTANRHDNDARHASQVDFGPIPTPPPSEVDALTLHLEAFSTPRLRLSIGLRHGTRSTYDVDGWKWEKSIERRNYPGAFLSDGSFWNGAVAIAPDARRAAAASAHHASWSNPRSR